MKIKQFWSIVSETKVITDPNPQRDYYVAYISFVYPFKQHLLQQTHNGYDSTFRGS